MEVIGKIIALSHIFKLVKQPIFIIEIYSLEYKEVYFIFVGEYHFSWHPRICPGHSYQISHLRKENLKDKEKVVLRATKKSKIILVSNTLIGLPSFITDSNSSEFVSLQSTVTAIVDSSVGIYQLEGRATLIISFIKELLAGLPGEADEKKESSSDAFRVGDKLQIFNVHSIRGKDDSVLLVCCAKSLIRCQRLLDASSSSNYAPTLSQSALLHCLHSLNFGLEFFHWLWEVQRFFVDSLPVEEERITRRTWNGVNGILLKFVGDILEGVEPDHRSLVEEFTKIEHACILGQEFERILPIKIEDIGDKGIERSEEDELKLWQCVAISKNEHNNFLSGRLKVATNGNLILEDKRSQIEVVILGSGCKSFSKVGRLVTISSFDYVEEQFNIYNCDKITKRYVLVHPKHILDLEDASLISSPEDKSTDIFYHLKISWVSGFNFFVGEPSDQRTNGFFVAKTMVHQENSSSNTFEVQNREEIVKFQGACSSVYPFLSDACILRGKIPADLHSEKDFKVANNFSWLNIPYCQLQSTKCIDFPAAFNATSVEPLNISSPSDRISQIVGVRHLSPKIVNICGVVVKRSFMTAKYDWQKVKIPLKATKEGVGFAENKLLRILIQDKEFSNQNIWVYLGKNNKISVPQYPLGIIPGAEISITWLECIVSNNNYVYLSSTRLTRVTIERVTRPLKEHSLPTKHQFICELSQMLTGRMCLIFASLSIVLKVTLKTICPSCESDLRNGSCSYVGCHANKEGVIAGACRFVVDDGSGTASVFLKDLTLIRFLFDIRDNQWNIIENILKEEPLNYDSKMDKFSASPAQRAFNALVGNPQNFRPLKIVGRIFAQPSNVDHMSLFGLSVQAVDPKTDFVLFPAK